MLIMQELIDIVSTVGFPIAISVYLLYERDRTVKLMTKTLDRIEILIEERLK